MIDIQELKQRFPLSECIRGCGIRLRPAGGELVGLCPFHDDRTPSFFVNDSKQLYHCFGCGASGDILDFLQQFHGVDFKTAMEIAGAERTTFKDPAEPAKLTEAPKSDDAAKSIWACAGPVYGTPAERYLEQRGLPLSTFPTTPWLRFSHTWHRAMRSELPALIAAFTDLSGAVRGIQRIFISPEGQKIDHPEAKLSLGSLRGNAVRLGQHSDKLIICEGLEDGLTLWSEMPDHSVWIAGGTSNLCQLEIPPSVSDLTIAADNDEAGRCAALRAAEIYLAPDRSVRISPPPVGFKDFNEMRQSNVR